MSAPRESSKAPWRLLVALVAGVAVGLALFGRPSGKRPESPPAATAAPATSPSPAAAAGTASSPATPRPPPTASPSRFWFTDVTQASGIRFQHVNGRTGRYRYPEILGAGVALFDYDGDGDLDVFLVNGNHLEGPVDPSIRSALYRNEGHATFTDVTEAAGLAFAGYGQGACVGDADGDGHPDLHVTGFGRSRFFHNRGDGTFVEKAVGLDNDGWGQSCAFLDYDGDGHLDLYVLNYVTYSLDMPQERYVVLGGRKVQDYLGPQAFSGSVSRLFRNRGGGTFVDVTRTAGVYKPNGKGMGLACVDFDGDGRTDIFVANDEVENYLFHNEGDGTFAEVGLQAGVAVSGDGRPKASMGVDVGDFDNDGRLDLVTPVVRQEVYSLFHNEGTLFTDVSWSSGLAATTGRTTGFSPHFGDFDNDGFLDLFFTNGEVVSRETGGADADDLARYGTPDLLLANDRVGHFVDVSGTAGPYFQRALIGRGAAAGDLDDDGRVDLVISNAGGPALVLRNEGGGGHWITLSLRDRGSNWEALGAKVWLTAGGQRQYRELHGGGGYLSANDRRLHFGLGGATLVDQVEIRWPDGAREVRRGLPVDRMLPIERKRP